MIPTNKMRALLLIFSITFFTSVLAQDFTVRGFIYEAESGEGAAYVKVILTKDGAPKDAPVIGATTDLEGFFSIPKLDKGTYTIVIRSMDHVEVTDKIELKDQDLVSVRYELEKRADVKDLEGVNVYADDRSKKTKVEMSVNKLDQKGLERLPSFGAENDVMSAMSVTPGVVTTGDQGGQMYVRGGTPIQNKILLDGMTIYNPFHSIGFFSVMETELIKSADIYTGGFSAEYGGRIASIMDVTYRDGNMKEFGGKASVSPFMGKLVLEGPLFRPEDENSGNGGSFIFASKHSLLDYTSRTLYPYANDGQGLPFTFTDIYGKATIKSEEGSKFSAFGFSNNDAVLYPEVADLNWKSLGAGMNFVLVPLTSQVLIKGHLNASNYEIFFQEQNGEAPRTSSITGFDLGFDFTYFLGNSSEITYGINVGGFGTDFRTFNQVNRLIQREDYNTEFSGYINYRMVKGRWVFNPSLRVQAYASIPDLIIEPRLGAKYNVNENLRWKIAGGRYSQNFTSAASDRDIVTLFYGFLSAPTDVQENFTKPNGDIINPQNGLQIAWHGITGFEYDFTRNLSLNIEGYYKYFPQLSNINLNKLYDDTNEFNEVDDVFKKDFIIESGYAYGVDVLLEYEKDRLFLWGVYSYMKSERWDGFQWYAPVFDRRHNINLVGNYLFGKNKDIELSLRWNFGSGLPFTPTTGYFQGEPFSDGVTTDYTTSNPQELSILLGTLNSARLPTYHRFDITVKKRWEFKKSKSLLEATLGVTNIYNRENIFYVNRVTNEKVFQLPVLPSIGVSYSF